MPDDPRLMSIEEPLPDEVPAKPEDDDAEPEGAVEVSGRRMVDVSVVAAERKRAREKASSDKDKEYEPLKTKTDELQKALDAARPYVDLVKQNQHLLNQPQKPSAPEISDSDAEQEARDLQLYTPDSKLDIATAKKIITRRRAETKEAAIAAAREATAPLHQDTHQHGSRQNFAAMCSMKDADGQQLIDPKILAQEWVLVPPEVTANWEGAEVVLDRAIGKAIRLSKGKRSAPDREPVFSESPGGRSSAPLSLTENAKKMGLTATDLKNSDKTFVPGNVSAIGDWT